MGPRFACSNNRPIIIFETNNLQALLHTRVLGSLRKVGLGFFSPFSPRVFPRYPVKSVDSRTPSFSEELFELDGEGLALAQF